MKTQSLDMPPDKALACASDLEKFLMTKGVWYTISRVQEPELKYIKVEVSIKVKQ